MNNYSYNNLSEVAMNIIKYMGTQFSNPRGCLLYTSKGLAVLDALSVDTHILHGLNFNFMIQHGLDFAGLVFVSGCKHYGFHHNPFPGA